MLFPPRDCLYLLWSLSQRILDHPGRCNTQRTGNGGDAPWDYLWFNIIYTILWLLQELKSTWAYKTIVRWLAWINVKFDEWTAHALSKSKYIKQADKPRHINAFDTFPQCPNACQLFSRCPPRIKHSNTKYWNIEQEREIDFFFRENSK